MQLFTPKDMSDITIPKKEEWNTFYQLCKDKNNFNIACIGPRDTCKSTLLNAVILDFTNKHPEISQKKLVYRFSIFDEIHPYFVNYIQIMINWCILTVLMNLQSKINNG